MPEKTAPETAAEIKPLLEALDPRLVAIHAARLADLGPDASGLFEHYRLLVEGGSLLRRPEVDRVTHIVRHLPAYDHYVVYRAGLGEIALALAAAGRKVTAWEANALRRKAIEAGRDALAADFPAIAENLAVVGEAPAPLGAEPDRTSLGIGFDLLLVGPGEDEAEAVRATLGVHALLYEPRLFLRLRDEDQAEAEARALLEQAGFDDFRPVPLSGLALATRGTMQPATGAAQKAIAAAGACKGAFAISGASFSGSTLLNALLGAHPQVAGGGELHWLTTEFERGRCAICGEDCRVWTPERRAAVTHENLYDMTADAFGRPFVADASKKADWFKALQHMTPDLPVTNLLIAKHPVRHVSSYVHKARFKPNFNGDPDYVLRTLRELYQRTEAQLPPDLAVRYEDLATDPKTVVTQILKTQGLDWDDRIDDWQAQPHHHIGGNMGPRAQIERSTRIADESLTRKYARDGVFLDDSYLDILDEATFERINRNPDAIAICAMFGYEPLPFGAEARANA